MPIQHYNGNSVAHCSSAGPASGSDAVQIHLFPQEDAWLGRNLTFSRIGTGLRSEWLSILPDATEVIVGDFQGRPNPLDVQKAVAIVQDRAYFEGRARQLIAPFAMGHGNWRLARWDFGEKAKVHDSEFVICLTPHEPSNDSATGAYVEVGFALLLLRGAGPMFALTVTAATGLAG